MTDTKLHSIVVIILCLWCAVALSKRFPRYVEKCHRNDPDMKLCLIKAIDILQTHFDRGVPEFGFPPMSPLVVSQISLDDDSSFKAAFNDVRIYDLDKLRVDDVSLNLNENNFFVKVFIPHLRFSSNYNIQGKLLFLQLDGRGPADGNLTNINAEVTFQAQRYKKQSGEYFKFHTMKIKESIKTASFKFDGLFRGNPELTEQTNKVVNENIQEILEELRPSIHLAVQQTILGIIGRMFNKFSVQELFPE